MSDEELVELYNRVSNLGRWGENDELGTLNYISPDKRTAAAALVHEGRVVSVGRDLATTPDALTGESVEHRILFVSPTATFADDYVGINPHGYTITHLDAVAHSTWNGALYNGRRVEETQQENGLTFGSIYAMRNGIVTRGVLLDVAGARSVPYLEPTEMVTVQDLEAAEHQSNVRVGRGDALFVRVGLRPWEDEHGPQDPHARAGLGAKCVEWMHEREVALFGGDCIELMPYPSEVIRMPLHHIGMPSMGLALLDWPEVEELSSVCKLYKRWAFMLTVAPIRLRRATGAAVNPLCIF